jgi:polar amino acid transport system substrate-binding protein
MKGIVSFLKTRKGRYFLAIFLIIFAAFIAMRGCSRTPRTTQSRFHIAIDRSWYPLALYGKENNLLAFADELLDAIGRESGLTFDVLDIRTANLIPDLDNGFYDGMISAMPPTHLNMIRYRFSDPIYLLGPLLVVRSDSPIKSLEELAGRFVGIRRGASLQFDVPFPNANITPYDNMTVALADLDNNKIDALIMDSLQAYVQIQGIYAGKVKIVTSPLTQDGLRLVTLNKTRYNELFDLFNKSLSSLKENGTYEELLRKWGLFNPRLSIN